MSVESILAFLDRRSFIDISIISFLVLIFYSTLRYSGSWRIGLRILRALVLYLIARFIKLPGLEWLFNNLSNIALIALIIIFQPEIRRIFERTTSTFKIKKLLKETSEFITYIVKALFSLAQCQWGAIFIIPCKDDVSSKLLGVVSINAEVSIPLILSLFDPHSPGS